MTNFDYYLPTRVVFGENSVKEVGRIASQYGKRALVISYDDISFYGDLFQTIHQSLEEAGITYEELLIIRANPTIAQAKIGIAKAKEMNADVLIGVGGGGVIDCTKVMAAGVKYPYEDIRRMVEYDLKGTIPPEDALPTVMIPTISATGSEMNCCAVITDEIEHRKSGVFSHFLYPKAAIVDPSLSKTLPPYQTAVGGIDIMSHIMECYFNAPDEYNTLLQDNLQTAAARTVLATLPVVMEHPDDVQARGVMQWSAALAQNGWLSCGSFQGGPMHQLGHVLSAHYNATHGAAMGAIMVAWIRFFSRRADNQRYVSFAKDVFGCDVAGMADAIEQMMKDMGIETRISQFGASETDIDALTQDVVTISFDQENTLPGARRLTSDEVKEIYRMAF